MMREVDPERVDFVEGAIGAGEEELGWAGLVWIGDTHGASRTFWEPLSAAGAALEIEDWGIFDEEIEVVERAMLNNN
jgi:hypothetical protein